MRRAMILKELTEFARDRRLAILAAIVLILSLVSVGVGAVRQVAYQQQQAAAVAEDRRIWLDQGEVNPHSAAHFGLFAFKPRAAMSLFDPGLSPWLGDAVWLEAHYKNPAQARQVETDAVLQRFGDLSPAWMLQTLLPLLIVLAGSAAVAGDRERGTLKLQLAQGARPPSLLFAKFAALSLVSLGVVAVLTVAGGVAALIGGATGADLGVRWGGLFLVYSAYAVIWSALTITLSALAGTARQALVVLLAVWALALVVAPRAGAAHAGAAYPGVTAGDFWERATELREQGIDGHNPANERTAAIRQAYLDQYGVDTVEELPFDFSGVTLQLGEEYGNQIYDRLYGEIARTEAAQADLIMAWSPLSPVLAARTLSAGLAGNDLTHQARFTAAAEAHRREVQRRLNEEQRLHGKGQDFNNKVEADFWEEVATFQYRTPAFTGLWASYGVAAAILLGWLLASLALVALAARRLEKRA